MPTSSWARRRGAGRPRRRTAGTGTSTSRTASRRGWKFAPSSVAWTRVTQGNTSPRRGSGATRAPSWDARAPSDAGCDFTLIGHSERRDLFKEDNTVIKAKIHAAINHQINPILCIGESEECSKAGKTRDFLKNQLITALSEIDVKDQVAIAYEPIWAIGSGNTPTAKDINSIHEFIKDVVQSSSANNTEPKVLYGGSVSNKNAEEFFNEKSIDGALVGGASLSANQFADIVKIYRKVKIK